MSLVEGKGKVPPSPDVVTISASEVEYVRLIAERRNSFRGYAHRQDTWGRGLIRNPAFCGLLGEHGLCSYLNKRLGTKLAVDGELRIRGDGGRDIEIAGMSVELKTRVTGERYLVRRLDDRRRIKEIVSDYVAFSKLISEREIHLLGWQTRSQFRLLSKLVKSTRGEWWNLDIDERELRPMSQLVEEFQFWRAA